MEGVEEGIGDSTQSSSCSKCSHTLLPSDNFCAKCGEATHAPEERNTNIRSGLPPRPTYVVPPRPRRSREEDVLIRTRRCYKLGCEEGAAIYCQAGGCSNKGCQRHVQAVSEFCTGCPSQYCDECASNNASYKCLWIVFVVVILLIFGIIVSV